MPLWGCLAADQAGGRRSEDRNGPGGESGRQRPCVLLNDDIKGYHEVVRARDISDFIVAVRNKGAHAVAILDVVHAALAAIEVRQRATDGQSVWSFVFMAARAIIGRLPNRSQVTEVFRPSPLARFFRSRSTRSSAWTGSPSSQSAAAASAKWQRSTNLHGLA